MNDPLPCDVCNAPDDFLKQAVLQQRLLGNPVSLTLPNPAQHRPLNLCAACRSQLVLLLQTWAEAEDDVPGYPRRVVGATDEPSGAT